MLRDAWIRRGLSSISGPFFRHVGRFWVIGRVNIVVLHEAAVQEELLVDDVAPPVHGLEVLGRVGVVRSSSRGSSELRTSQYQRVVDRVLREGGSLAGLGRIALSHVVREECRKQLF